MFYYLREQLSEIIAEVIAQNITGDAFTWLKENVGQKNTGHFNRIFASIPGKIKKTIVTTTQQQQHQIASILPLFSIDGWPADRLARAWLLMHLDASDQQAYVRNIENLFLTADGNEQEALYASLSLLAYPEIWVKRCAEGIRSNIGTVLQSIICNNPYASTYLNNQAWNQLVLKAFFTDKPIHQIIGLEKRNNKELADTLVDYAHERWAAGRSVNPQLWRFVAPFIDENNLADIAKVFNTKDAIEMKAAALACNDSNYAPAKDLLQLHPDLINDINNKRLTWQVLGEEALAVPA